MKQWNAKGVLTLGMLSLSLVASSVFAQVAGSDGNSGNIATEVDNSNTVVDDADVNSNIENNAITNQNVPLNLKNSRIESQPVIVTPGMSPGAVAPAPVVVIPDSRAGYPVQVVRPSTDSSTIGSPQTGIGGSNPGNANTGGVQVVSVQTAQDSRLSNEGRAEALRRERMRQELDNEVRLIEKVEEGRLEDERTRSSAIGSFSAASASAKAKADGSGASAEAQAQAGTITTVPVTPVGVNGSGASAQATAVAVSGGEISMEIDEPSSSRFSIQPFGGHRWMEDGATQFKVNNVIITGVNLTGQMNDFLAIEGSFTYGRDEMKRRFGQGLAQQGVGGYHPYGGNYNSNAYNPYNGGYDQGGYGQGGVGYGQGGVGYGPQSYAPWEAVRSRDSFDVAANAKLGMFNNSFRPYGLLGLGGMMQHYNIDNRFTTGQARVAGWDRNTTHMTAQFGGGLDVEIGPKFTVGARFDYQKVFDSNKYRLMNALYGDGMSRYRLVGSVALVF